MKNFIYLSWAFLAVSIAVFSFFVYEAENIVADAADRASTAANQEQQLDKTAYAERLHAVVTDTKSERDSLDAFARTDVTTTVQELESAGQSAGVNAKVTDATAENGNGSDLPGGDTILSIIFSLTGDGSYAQIIHAVETYERLPLASKITQLDIEHDPNAKDPGASWHMTMRIRVVTIASSL